MQMRLIIIALLGIITTQKSASSPTLHTAFHGGAPWRSIICPRLNVGHTPLHQRTRLLTVRGDNSIVENIANFFGVQSSKRKKSLDAATPPSDSSSGHVIRTASRPYQTSTGGSIPSSRFYTTRKDSLPMITVAEAGVVGDYNHYRTVALKSTVDRAISILTNDVSTHIKSLEGGSFSNRYREGEKNCPLSLFMNLIFLTWLVPNHQHWP